MLLHINELFTQNVQVCCKFLKNFLKIREIERGGGGTVAIIVFAMLILGGREGWKGRDRIL